MNQILDSFLIFAHLQGTKWAKTTILYVSSNKFIFSIPTAKYQYKNSLFININKKKIKNNIYFLYKLQVTSWNTSNNNYYSSLYTLYL